MNFSGPPPHLFAVFLDVPGTVWPDLHQLLNAEERKRAAAFHFDRDRKRWTTTRAALRLLLAEKTGIPPREIAFSENAAGKPFLAHPGEPPMSFNLSHAADHALMLFSDTGPVGVDLERFRRGRELETCLASFCSAEEIRQWEVNANQIERCRFLIKIWCAKEAFLKALGVGLTQPPETLITEWLTSDCMGLRTGNPGDAPYQLHFPPGLEERDFCAAVALPGGMICPEIRWFDAAQSL